MSENWLDRWASGRTGWHEADGNAGLKQFWQTDATRVLVPLCGKSPDLAWLARRGHEVVGVELAEMAVREFFSEQQLAFEIDASAAMACYRCTDLPITLYCGDYFQFAAEPFDAVYDRGALVAVDPDMRARYVEKTKSLLRPGGSQFLITLEYDQAVVQGPPFSLMPDELMDYYSDLIRLHAKDDIDNCPPKFRAAGLMEVKEVIWCSSG